MPKRAQRVGNRPAGCRRTTALAQRWLVQIMEVGDSQVTVQRMVVGPDGLGQVTISDLGSLKEAMLVVSGLTPVTTEPASYSYSITQQ